MAAKGLQVDHNTFSCSICLDYLKEPVTIPCGHSYCMSCVNTHWNGEVGKQSYSCPQCRQSFTQRPVLVKNTMLAVLMEGLKKSGPPAAPVAPSSAAHGDVFCDLCSGRKVKAVKSCLQCLVSYCKEHLQPHYDVAALKKHKLVEPTENLQENICSRHDEVMKMFCRTDQQCICYLCSVDQHKGHDTVTAAAERTEKQRELQTFQQDLLQRIKLKQKDLTSLIQQWKNSSRSAEAALNHSDRSLNEMLQLLDERMREVKQQVRSKQEAEADRFKELEDKVQQEVKELRRKFIELDTLSHCENHVHFLHQFASLSKVSETSESVNSSQTPPPFHDMVTAAVSKLMSAIQETCLLTPPAAVHKPKASTPKTDALPVGAQTTAQSQQTSKKDEKTVALPLQPQPIQGNSLEEFPALPHRNLKPKTPAPAPQPVQPVGRSPCQPYTESNYFKMKKYARKITWDLRSLNDKLQLSGEDLIIKRMPCSQNHWHHPFRFTGLPQAVSKQSLTGQCYFEVSLYYDKVCTVAVAYKDIKREGSSNQCSFGKSAKSWALECYRNRCFVWHNGQKVEIPHGAYFVGVFVDYNAGVLTFYRQNCQLEAIYSFKTTFTQPLVAGVRLDGVGNAVALCSRMFWDTSS